MNCKKCLEAMNSKRWELGYRICVACSNEPKWSGVPVINHKTGNEIQIVKDPDVAAEFLAKSARTGFGTLRGMSKSYKKHSDVQKPIELLPDKPLVDRELSRTPLQNDFEAVGSEVMELLETGQTESAYRLIDDSLLEKRIYKIHAEQLRQIVETLSKNC